MAAFPPDDHYRPPDHDVAGRALLEEFERAGLPAVLLSPSRLLLQLPDGSQAQSDIDVFRTATREAAPQECRAEAERYVGLAAQSLRRATQGDQAGDLNALRTRLYPEEMLTPELRENVVARELGPGLWETVVVDFPDSVQPLPSGGLGSEDPDRRAQLFAAAIANTLSDPHETSTHDQAGIPLVHIGGEHPYMAAHIHALDQHLGERLRPDDGALVSFPVPQVLLAHPLGESNPLLALEFLQALAARFVEDAAKPITDRVFWWRPATMVGAPPPLQPAAVRIEDDRAELTASQEFADLVQRLMSES